MLLFLIEIFFLFRVIKNNIEFRSNMFFKKLWFLKFLFNFNKIINYLLILKNFDFDNL